MERCMSTRRYEIMHNILLLRVITQNHAGQRKLARHRAELDGKMHRHPALRNYAIMHNFLTNYSP
jgi:hypothetical protein